MSDAPVPLGSGPVDVSGAAKASTVPSPDAAAAAAAVSSGGVAVPLAASNGQTDSTTATAPGVWLQREPASGGGAYIGQGEVACYGC